MIWEHSVTTPETRNIRWSKNSSKKKLNCFLFIGGDLNYRRPTHQALAANWPASQNTRRGMTFNPLMDSFHSKCENSWHVSNHSLVFVRAFLLTARSDGKYFFLSHVDTKKQANRQAKTVVSGEGKNRRQSNILPSWALAWNYSSSCPSRLIIRRHKMVVKHFSWDFLQKLSLLSLSRNVFETAALRLPPPVVCVETIYCRSVTFSVMDFKWNVEPAEMKRVRGAGVHINSTAWAAYAKTFPLLRLVSYIIASPFFA